MAPASAIEENRNWKVVPQWARGLVTEALPHESSVAAEPVCGSASVTSDINGLRPYCNANFGAAGHE
jgi:hypothetical protein